MLPVQGVEYWPSCRITDRFIALQTYPVIETYFYITFGN
jgi:hypothetical protein